ncbi:GntR family transcriptional regulator [Demequina soli]|uniref:GntR family transcriptional regulator n=1 Tax=Demequina soli TaxID=1638987 RepID=UPI000783DDDE|nr:GntR family transcriptional regulator [Demequina soli]
MTLDRSRATPLHVQVEERLLADLDDGAWAPGDRLPAEPDLAARFGVNRLTVREAIASLRRAGRLVARQGAGTFVAAAPLRIDLDASGAPIGRGDGTADLREEVLAVGRARLSAAARHELGVDDGLEVETLTRIAGAPVMRSVYSLATTREPDDARRLLEGPWASARLGEVVGVPLRTGWRAFDAVAATRREAELLDVEPGAPLLRRSGVNLDAAGAARTFHARSYRSDRLRIVLR